MKILRLVLLVEIIFIIIGFISWFVFLFTGNMWARLFVSAGIGFSFVPSITYLVRSSREIKEWERILK